jgi:DNA-binding transcriptional LysR family regulator
MDKLTSMKVFSMVAKLRSFSAAAEKLKISRAMASKHVQYLENNLGVRLLNRTTRHLSLTEVGTSYQERVNVILADIDDADLAITQLSSEPRGILKIMAPPSFGAFHLARVITSYNNIYPEVSIELILTDRHPDLVEEGMDMAFHVGPMHDSSLVARKLATARMVVCGSPEFLDKKGPPKTPADLDNYNCLLFTPRIPINEWQFTINGKEKSQHITGTFRSNVGDALRVAAIKGAGLVQLPTYMVGLDIKSGRLLPVLGVFEPAEKPIYAIYSHRKYLSAKIRTFVDFIYDLLHPIPYWDEWTDERSELS